MYTFELNLLISISPSYYRYVKMQHQQKKYHVDRNDVDNEGIATP